MWISKRTSEKRGEFSGPEMGRVTIGGANTAVLTEGEKREIRAIAPVGVAWQPCAGGDVIVLENAAGETFVLGTVVPECGLADGEVLLQCGGTRLKIGAEGIDITGTLRINGMAVTGGEER